MWSFTINTLLGAAGLESSLMECSDFIRRLLFDRQFSGFVPNAAPVAAKALKCAARWRTVLSSTSQA
jgi:hypothetical protein